MKILAETIDCEPTWESLLPEMIKLIRYGSEAQKTLVEKELLKIARSVDETNRYIKQHRKPNTLLKVAYKRLRGQLLKERAQFKAQALEDSQRIEKLEIALRIYL